MSDSLIPRTSIVDTVSERLRRDLVMGKIPPGARIRIGELEQQFGVSHIPIREALRRLEAEGLVITSPQRATIAASLALDDLKGLYDLRKLIEVPVAVRAAERATDEDVRRLREALKDLEQQAGDPASVNFWECHRDFHTALLAPGSTAWVDKTLEQLWHAAERYVRITVSTLGTITEAMQDHRKMVKAFSQRDGPGLAELTLRHLTRTEGALTKNYLAKNGDASESEADLHVDTG